MGGPRRVEICHLGFFKGPFGILTLKLASQRRMTCRALILKFLGLVLFLFLLQFLCRTFSFLFGQRQLRIPLPTSHFRQTSL